MLDGLLMAKGVVALATFVLALIAFLTMMQMRKKIPAVLPGTPRDWRNWHVVSGRLSLACFLLLAFIGMGLAGYLYRPATTRAWLHVIVSVLTTFAFLAKVVVVRRRMQPWFRQLVPFGIVLFILHLAIFLSATIWAYWFKFTGVF
jgi:hypothetical protein